MKLKKIAAWGLAISMTLSLDIPGVNAAGSVGETTASAAGSKEEQIQIAQGTDGTPGQIPGTDREFFTGDEDIREWFNVSGYAANDVQDRSEYYEEYVSNGYKNTKNYIVVEEDGYWKNGTRGATAEYLSTASYDALDSDAQKSYRSVTAEEQFTTALNAKPKVIQVNAEELELGFHYLEANKIPSGPVSPTSGYDKADTTAKTNPVIMNEEDAGGKTGFTGTGISDIDLYSHLTLFSTTGCKIHHTGFSMGSCNDIIIRNFQMDGMYEWDEPSYGGTNYDSHKRFGWSNIKCSSSSGIWIDHCTFGFAFDGNIDLENGSSVSVTWCRFGEQDLTVPEGEETSLPKWDESKGCELWKNILYMEECYQAYLKNPSDKTNYYPEYYELRGKDQQNGATPKEIMEYAAFHSKVHLVGTGEKDFYTNIKEQLSLGYSKYTSVIQRIPMIRSGNGMMYNCVVDNRDFQKRVAAIQSKNVSCDHFYRGYVSVNNARNGASIGTDTSVFYEVTPNCGVERQGQDTTNVPDAGWSNIISYMVNHNLTVNSKVTLDEQTYTGSSWDSNGNNLFNKKWTWDNRATIGDFKWATWKEGADGVDQFRNEGDLDNNKISTSILSWSNRNENGYDALYKKFFEGSSELGFSYKCFQLDDVEDKLNTYAGAQKQMYGEGETMLDYIQPYNRKTVEDTYTLKVTVNTNGDSIITNTDDIESIEIDKSHSTSGNTYYLKAGETLTLPKPSCYGYNMVGWKKGVYEGGKLAYTDVDMDEDGSITITAPQDGYQEETYYVFWEFNTWTVTFDTMGGNEENTTIQVKHRGTITSGGGLPANPTKEGATFRNWCIYSPETQTYGASINAKTTITADVTYYAKWRNTVTFDTDGGGDIAEKKVDSGGTIGTVTTPAKEGYTFVGWYRNKDEDGNFSDPFDPKTDKVMEPMTLYAKYRSNEQKTVTVSFDTNIENVTMDAITVNVGSTGSAIAAVEPPQATDEAIEFGGWYYDDEEDGFTKPFDPDAEIIDDITLHAKWVKKEEPPMIGDVNGDKIVTTSDALEILKHLAHISSENFYEDRADLNGDTHVTTADALAILQILAKQTTSGSE